MNETEIPMFDRGDYVKDKFGNIFKIITALAPQRFERDSFEYDEMGYQLELIEKAPNTRAREVGDDAVFHREGDEYWIFNTEADIRDGGYEVVPETIVATELVLFEKSEDTEEVREIEIPMFNKGDIVKDKFGNLYAIEDLVSPQQLERDTPEYDHMGYRLKIIEKNTSLPARKIGNVSGFYSDDACMWIYNTFGDAVNDEVLVTDAHIFATELELYDEEDEDDADDVEDIEVSDVPIFLVGDLVKDKFGNIFEVVDADKFEDFSGDCMHYNVGLVIKHPDSPIRKAGGAAEFEEVGCHYWIYDTAEDAASRGVIVNDRQLLATELVLVQSVLQTKSTKSDKSKIQKPVKPVKPAKPAKAEKAEIAKRYPSIEDLQKISEENDLGKLLDQAYEILKEQALQGERRSNLEADKFKRCIPHFEREGFDITEHGMLIEVRW